MNININKLKSEHNFIGLSFIADDLDASQFIDDKCFGDILYGLDKDNYNNNKNKEKKSDKKEKETININKKSNYYNDKKDNDPHCYKTIKTDNNIDKKEKKDENNKEDDKLNNKRPFYNRRFYRSLKGEKKSENE